MTMQDRVRDFAVPQRFHAILFSLFAAITLLLAVSGLYGLVRFLVARRTQEIGVRIALGASPAGIATMVVRSALRFTLAGAALGIAGALLMSRWLESMLYQTRARDPLPSQSSPRFSLFVPSSRLSRLRSPPPAPIP